MQYRPDIVLTDASGAAIAIVEVKALGAAGTQTATRYLRNLLAHGVVPHARYALLITPESGYLWRTPDEVVRESAPRLTFPMGSITQHYLPPGSSAALVPDLVLQSIAAQWLSDLADGIIVDRAVTDSLRDAGFLDAVRHAQVNTHIPA